MRPMFSQTDSYCFCMQRVVVHYSSLAEFDSVSGHILVNLMKTGPKSE